jgi:signal transduction histidine kinase
MVAGHMILRFRTVAGNTFAPAPQCQNRRMAVPRAVVPVVALAYGIAVLAVKPWASDPPTAYAGASTLAAAVGLVAGIGLLATGSALWLEPRRDRAALLLVLTGVASFAPDWLGWDDGPSIVRSVGAVVAPFLPALLLDLVATVAGGRIARLGSDAVYASTAVVSVGRALFRDPFLDPRCWSNCTDNLFLVDADQGIARALDSALPRVTLAASVLVISFAAWRAVTASPAARQADLPLLVALALAGAAEAAYGLALILDPAESAERASFRALYIASGAALSLVALAAAWTIARARQRRSAVARLAADLEAAPAAGALAGALGRSLGDPGLEVAYPVGDRLVDGDGQPVAAGGRTATPLVRAGRTVAVLLHETDALPRDELERELGSAARLAIENERLRAEVLSRLDDLRASRVRIVETADAERRRLERDLHDGAQQQLLALSYDLRRALSDANGELAPVLRAGVGEVQAALDELRELAHGIHPAILTEAGLGAALRTLADAAQVPLEIVSCTDERLPPAAEAAAYAVAVEALERTGKDGLALRAARQGDMLVVDAEGPSVAPTIHLADRVGALGGTVAATARGLRAEIPCA